MESRTVDLNIATLIWQLTREAGDDPAVRIQLYHALTEVIASASLERLGLDGTLSWTLEAITKQDESPIVQPARQQVVEACERRCPEVDHFFAQSESARANFVYLHQADEDANGDNGRSIPRTISGQVGSVRIDLNHHLSAEPILVTNANVREDLRQAIRDAERAAMDYLAKLGLQVPHRPGNGLGFGLICDLDEVELTRGGRSVAAAALVAIVSRVLAQAGVFNIPRHTAISGDVAWNSTKGEWALRPVDGEDKVRVVETYYPNLKRVVLVTTSAPQRFPVTCRVEVVAVATVSELMQTVFGVDCEERFCAAIAQLNERWVFQRDKQTLARRARWMWTLPMLVSLLACVATLFPYLRREPAPSTANARQSARRQNPRSPAASRTASPSPSPSAVPTIDPFSSLSHSLNPTPSLTLPRPVDTTSKEGLRHPAQVVTSEPATSGITRRPDLLETHQQQHPYANRLDCDALFLERPEVNAPEMPKFNLLAQWYRRGEKLDIPLFIYNCGQETWQKDGWYLDWNWKGYEALPTQPHPVDRDIRPGEIWQTRLSLTLPNLLGTQRLSLRMKRSPEANTEFGDYLDFDVKINRPPDPPVPRRAEALENRLVSLDWDNSGLNDQDNPRPAHWGNARLKYRVEIQPVGGRQSLLSGWMTEASWRVPLPDWGAYRWRVQAHDGMEEGEWSEWRSFMLTPP